MKSFVTCLGFLMAFNSSCATTVFKGSQTTLTMTSNNVQLSQEGRVLFDARKVGQKILNDSSCPNLSYHVLPLSKAGTIFSFMEEIYLDGKDCGAKGYSYNRTFRSINLTTGADVTLSSLGATSPVLAQLQRDTYLKKAAAGQVWNEKNVDEVFSDWNRNACSSAMTSEFLRSFYVFDARRQPASIRLGLAFACIGPTDGPTMPTQLGVLMNIKFNRADDFDFQTIKKHVGDGVTLGLKR